MAKYKYTPKTKEELKDLVNNLDIYLGDIDTQYITDMSHLFYNSKRGNSNFSGIELWNTSNVINMDYMFANTLSFNQDISSWDVSSVESMKSMFWGAESFNQPLELWNVSKVRNMNAMFCDTLSFNQPLNKWNVSNVQDMAFLFSATAVFNQPIGDWNISSVTTMKCMFSNAKSFNQDISNWNVSNVKNMYGMFWGAESFNQDISLWNISNITDTENMFKNAKQFNKVSNTISFKHKLNNNMQNGKIINITDRVISVELKYPFYRSVECSDFIRKSGYGYLCLYNFETKQISSIPAKLNKPVKDNVDSNTSVCIDILINEISDMKMDLLSNPAVFGFCLTKNTDTVILSELEDILTAQFKTDYLNKTEQKLDGRFLFILYITIAAFVFFVICTSSFIIALTYTLFFLIFIAFVLTVILEFKEDKEDDVNDEIAAIVNDWKKYKQVPFFKRRYVDKKMKQLLQRIRQVTKQQKEKQNDSANTKIKKQKYNASSDKKVMISLNQLSNLFLISDNDLRNVCSETYKLCQMVNSIEELANKKYLKEYIEKRLDRIEQVLNIWKSANRVSSVSSSEVFNVKQKSIETINLINNMVIMKYSCKLLVQLEKYYIKL